MDPFYALLISEGFKSSSDGRLLYFPFGALGRGYIIDSEQAYQSTSRSRRAQSIVSVVGTVLCVGALALDAFTVAILVGLLYIPCLVACVRFQLRWLQRSDERLTFDEVMTSQAILYGAVVLWLLEIAALAFVGLGIFLLIADSRAWPIMLAPVIFFGLCAAVFTRTLVLRRRAKAGSAR